jgi:glycosyltransferase involved in cell wall biosynthesis
VLEDPTVVSADDKKLKVVFVAAHDSRGGAARAAYRVFNSIRRYHSDEIDITLRVIHKTREDNGIIGGNPSRNLAEYAVYFARTRFRKYFPREAFQSDNTLLHSQALYATGLGRELNAMKADVIMLGWLGNSTLSIPEIGRLRPPLVFRLSDMWVFSGAEHYSDTSRYRQGYRRSSRPKTESGPDIDRETFLRKRRHWRARQHIVALSSWLAKESRSSTLTRNWPTHVIPVPIDTEYWQAEPMAKARKALGLPAKSLIVTFGAGAGTSLPHKGADLLFDALPSLRQALGSEAPRLQLAIFGEDGDTTEIGGFPVKYLGRLDDTGLKAAYSASDVVVVPSLLEAFGQVAAEAQACGAPVVAFDNSGLADVVADQQTGRLVPAFDTESLGRAIAWVLSDGPRRKGLRAKARERAVSLWHPKVVAQSYRDVLFEAAGKRRAS